MACTDRFSFRAIDGLSRPDASNAKKSCASVVSPQARPARRLVLSEALGTAREGETVMPTAEQCNAYAAEYRLLVQQVDVSIRRAATLMAISQSWIILAHQLERLADITKHESK